MKAEAEAYLRKARESHAAAEADLAADRYNACASRAYYAAFQAAVATLIENAIGPRGDSWEHRFVMSQFSGKLISARKVVPARLRGVLEALFHTRLIVDYREAPVGLRGARQSVDRSRDFVRELALRLEGRPQ